MLEALSAAYYVGRVYVEPHDGEHAVMDRARHEAAAREVYATGEGVERLDQPLVVKLDGQHLPVFGVDGVASDTLAVPAGVLEASRIDNPPTLRAVLVAKAERAAQLLAWWTPYTVAAARGA